MQENTFVDTVLSGMSEVVLYQDVEGRILWANQAAGESLDVSPEELTGRYCYEVRFGRDCRCEECPVPGTLHSGKRQEGEMTTPDGRRWHVQVYPHRPEDEGQIAGIVEINRDITGAYQARDQLRQDREQFQRLAESVKAILWEYNIKTDSWDYVSPQAENILGYRPPEWTDLQFWVQNIHPADRGWAVDYCMECTSRGEEHTFEYRFLKKEGGVAWLRDEVSVELDDAGNPAVLRGFMVDITQRKEAERALQESQKNLEVTLRSIGDGVIVTDQQGRVVRMNDTAEQLTGWLHREAHDKPIGQVFRLTETASGQSLQCPVKRVLKQKVLQEVRSDTTLISRDGGQHQITCTAAPIEDGEQFLGVVVVFSDVTEQYRIKQRLRESQRLVQSTLNSLSAHICVLDEQGNIISVNQPWLEFAVENGADLQKVQVGVNYLQVCDEVEDEDRETARRFADGIRSVMRGEREFFDLEYPCHSPDQKRWFVGRVTRHVGQDNGSSRVVIAHEDVTERRLAEQRLRFLSFHDSLTGLRNRAYLEEEINRLDVTRQLPISIIMADVNGLKLVNDAFGHEQGDEVLKKVAQILQESCRQEDIIARWGGDEFLILLPETSSAQAQAICDRIAQACDDVSQSDVPVSISLGSATKEEPGQEIYEILQEAEDTMYKRKLSKSRSTKNAVLTTLLRTLGAKTHETEQHAWRLQQMSLRLGEELSLPASELDRLALLASLHDVGKITISEDILTKPGSLTEKEWKAVRRHPEIGYRIASSTEEFAHVANDILSHHEQWDGTGYPRGLAGEDIPLLARIVAVVDAFDAMTNDRPYSEPVSVGEATAELKECSGSQFDPEIVDMFCRLIEQGEIDVGRG